MLYLVTVWSTLSLLFNILLQNEKYKFFQEKLCHISFANKCAHQSPHRRILILASWMMVYLAMQVVMPKMLVTGKKHGSYLTNRGARWPGG